jgi:hypothetical protein
VDNIKIWMEGNVVYRAKKGQKTTSSSMNKLYAISPVKKENKGWKKKRY